MTTPINLRRLIAGGLVAGLLMNVVSYAVNGILLGERWDDASRGLGLDPASNGAVSALGWIASQWLFGLVLVWFYAAIRPRFGAGPKTALLAAVALWAATSIAYGSFVFMGLYPGDLVVTSAAGALGAWVIGGLAGAAVYREG